MFCVYMNWRAANWSGSVRLLGKSDMDQDYDVRQGTQLPSRSRAGSANFSTDQDSIKRAPLPTRQR